MKIYALPADAFGCGHVQVPLKGTDLYATIDEVDVPLLYGHTWRLLQVGYVADSYGTYLHRLILRPRPKQVVDHKDRDPLNNCRLNLRLASKSQNGANRKPDSREKGTTSRFKGVCWQQDRRRWAAYIHVNGRTYFLGRFIEELDAALAYDQAATKTWGDFALLNRFKEEVVP